MEKKNKFTISYIFADKPSEINTSIYRCWIPCRALADAGYGASLIPAELFQKNTQEVQDILNKTQVIVVERNFFADLITQCVYWIVRGKIVIANFDDNYDLIEESNASFKFWHDGLIPVMRDGESKLLRLFPHPLWQFKLGLKICHAQIVPSKELMKYYGEYSPTYFVPNYFDTEFLINKPREERDYINIGWGGSLSHLQSFRDSGALAAFQNVCKVRDNVKVMICGDKRIYDLLEIPEDKKQFHPFVPHDQWGSVISKYFDIYPIPLSGEYDNYRSCIKPIEAMLTQTPWISSDSPAYHDLAPYGKLIKNSEENWTNALLDMIDNLSEEKEKAKEEPYQFALTWDIKYHTEEIADIFRLIAREHGNLIL